MRNILTIIKSDKNLNKVGDIKCKECDLIFKCVTVLKEHIREIHPTNYKCSNCESSFDSGFELETHLLNEHDITKEFNCAQCKKVFVTKWRLKKHVTMHSNANIKECYYYTSRTHCPFEKLGCKFGHGKSIEPEDNKTNMDDTSEIVNDLDTDTFVGKGFKENIGTSFCTSTPMKKQKHLLKCKDCLNLSEQCTACRIIQKIEETHVNSYEDVDLDTPKDNDEDFLATGQDAPAAKYFKY